MRKIPTLFIRAFIAGTPWLVTREVNPPCQWVIDGEGVATTKVDGTCAMVRDGALFKRRELRAGQEAPAGFEVADEDAETGKTVGWVPVSATAKEDRYFCEAFEHAVAESGGLDVGTYELVGPKVQGNPERLASHYFVRHGKGLAGPIDPPPPRDFDGIGDWFVGRDLEGIVWHHPDGRMAKIKARDFGLKRAETA